LCYHLHSPSAATAPARRRRSRARWIATSFFGSSRAPFRSRSVLRPGAKRLGGFGVVPAKLDLGGANIHYLRGKGATASSRCERNRQGDRIWHGLSTGRPGERRDPYAVSLRFCSGVDALLSYRRYGLWIPAFAGTTRGEHCCAPNQSLPVETGKTSYAIAVPQGGGISTSSRFNRPARFRFHIDAPETKKAARRRPQMAVGGYRSHQNHSP
jgi:hypothetical protein